MAEYIERELLKREIIEPLERTWGGFDGFRADAERLIDAVPAADVAPVPKWISVKDRLPEDERPVIAVYRFRVNAALYISTLSYFCFDALPHWQHESVGLIVTHWMPLPEPPKESRGGEEQ